MKKFLYSTFLIFLAILPQNSNADELDFYSRIDDAGDSLVQNLTKRQLQEFSSFKNFATECRNKALWLDKTPMSQSLLDEIANGGFAELAKIARENNKKFSNDEIVSLSNCLNSAYNKIKSSAISQKEIIEDAGSTGIFMDGDLENSDFDIIVDINKINEIIFKKPINYEWVKNPNKKSLLDYLSGEKPVGLGKTASEVENENKNFNNFDIIENWQNFSENNNSNSENNTEFQNEAYSLDWSNICQEDSHSEGKISDVNNMVDSRFLEDLNLVLQWWKNHNNYWIDYSAKKNLKNNSKNPVSNNSNSQWLDDNNSDSSSDFSTKLPCSNVFCIKFGSNISNDNLLVGGKGSNSIEWILEKHIEKLNPISYSNLSSQKMTNNTFQLPFLNLKFSSVISGGAVFVHWSPQTSKISPTTEKTQEIDFDSFQRCAWLESGLSTDFEKNNWIKWAGFDFNSAHSSENYNNSVKILGPIEAMELAGCGDFILNNAESRYYEWFSTQVNEFQTFTNAMLTIIDQILQIEQKFDNTQVK